MSETKITNELLLRMSETDRVKALELLSVLEKKKTQEEARGSFLKFVECMWEDFIPGPHHKRIAEAFEKVKRGEIKRLIINLPPRHALTLDTLIPTVNGFKSMQDIVIGDEVFHASGKPIKVLGKSGVFPNRELYKVTTDDGREVVCDGEHLWTVRLDRKRSIYQTHTTENLWKRQQGWFLRTKRGGGIELKAPDVWGKSDYAPVRLPMLPAFGAAQYTEKRLLIDPYVLGLWLGDGHNQQAIITSHDDDAIIVRPEIERRGYKTTNQATYCTFGILKLKVQLRELGLLGNKHIPTIYLEGSEKQRRDLLKGLMDSEGNVSKKGQCFFSQKSEVFVEQARTLLASLGIKSTLQSSEAKIGDVSYGIHHKCSFYASDIAFLQRKEERTFKTERTFGRYISIEKLNDISDTQCIKVDSDDGLFLVGRGYVCTHNTKSEFASYLLPAWWLGHNPKDQIMQISHTAELAEGFGRKVRNLVSSLAFEEVFDTRLSKDSTAAARWNTSVGGKYIAMGVGGAVAGLGANCVYFSSKVLTNKGIKSIANVQPGDFIMGYSHDTQRIEYTEITARADRLCERLTRKGEFIGTPDHKIYGYHGYVQAETTSSIAVLEVPKRVSSGQEGVRKNPITQWWADTKNLLLVFVFTPKDSRQGMRVWKREIGNSEYLHGVLSKGASCNINVPLVCKRVSEDDVCTSENYRPSWGRFAHVLHARMLRQGQGRTVYGSALFRYRMSSVQKEGARKNLEKSKAEVLFYRMLRKSWGTITGILRELDNPKTPVREKILSKMCSLWERIIAHGCSPYRPQCRKQRYGESSFTMPTMSFILPQNFWQWFTGRVKSLLPKYSYPVVDLQTRTSNFFVSYGNEWQLIHNCLILDDVISEQEGKSSNATPHNNVYDYFMTGPRQRLQPGGAIILVMTRWSKIDLTGRLVTNMINNPDGDQWEVIEFPAIMPSGKPLWEAFWSLEELEKTRLSLDTRFWNAQYMQNPTSEEGAIVKREWWRIWEKKHPPGLNFVLMSWDTAYEKHNRADYSAVTVWGIFEYDQDDGDTQQHIILLEMQKKRVEFPELKAWVLEMHQEWQPDSMVVEKRASGASLIQEIRRMGIPVQEFTPTRGNDKISRLNAVADIFASGFVWRPDTRWAEEVADEVAEFPGGTHDDVTDTVSQAMHLFRKGGFVKTFHDEPDEESMFRRKREYY